MPMPTTVLSSATPAQISIALIEDNRLVREGLTAMINRQPGLQVVVQQASGVAWSHVGIAPQVVLLDIGLRKSDSLRIAAQVRLDLPDSKIIIMDLLPAYEDIVEFVNAGVSGFIMKDATLEDLVSTIRAVAGGANVLPSTMVNSLFSQIAREAVGRVRPDSSEMLESVKMTPRERQVINLIAEGLSNKAIAARLHVAIHTVKSHVRNVMEKLTLHSRLQIAAYVHSETKK
jgi:DNA-binding NarL/FixJ family response regulator